MILVSYIAQKKILSPVMTQTYFHTPWLSWIVRALRTIPVWDISRGGSIADVKQAFSGIEMAMQQKQNILIYPSGHIYVQPFEHIVWKKMAYEIVKMLDSDTRVIIARTSGLWWSIWGKAYTGDSPRLMNVLWRSVWYIVANWLFFVPKRDVKIEFVDMTEDIKKWAQFWLDVFNQNLQDYYNAWWNEHCRYIPHYAYYNDTAEKKEPENIVGSIAEMSRLNGILESDILPDIIDQVKEKVAEIKKVNKSDILFSTNLVLDLHADSLDMAEMKSAIQSLFPWASNPPISAIKTVWDLSALALGKLEWESHLPSVTFSPVWERDLELSFQKDDTILSMLKKNFQSEKMSPFLYDALMGEMNRDTFLLRSYVIAEYLKQYPSQKIGIMIPALSATSLLLVGTYLSEKLPVMLNWTVWEKSFAHCMQFAHLDVILTSRKFYEKIQSPWLEKYEDKMIFIEDIIRDLSLFIKIKAWMKKSLFLIPKSGNDAVILFTSGSESLPKAVVLSHENIISDITWAIALVPFRERETLLGFLPPFHSFGFTINTIFPLIAPIQVAYTPDPSDARTIWKILSHTHASIITATPTFLRMILANNTSSQLASIRYGIMGAEKCSDEVFSLFHEKCPNATILEWYGITECSPIVTVNPWHLQKKWSVGQFLPHIQYRIRSLDTHLDMAYGEQGMIYVRGSSIFSGYLDPSLESPFEIIDGEEWYKTWDLGYVDADRFLFITGRLKRFIKIAGEMISLPFIEGILSEKYGNPEMPTLALESREDAGVLLLVLFTIFDLSVDEANAYIHTHGASNLIKIDRVQKIESIPVLGTGKIDYKSLKSLI